MSCGCSSNLQNGMDIVDHIKSKGKETLKPKMALEIPCQCGKSFTLETVVMNCPNCGMTYAVTPCSSDDINNVVQAGVRYA